MDGYGPVAFPYTDEGMSQFISRDSQGIKPSSPDGYYTRLVGGKEAFNYARTNLRLSLVDPTSPEFDAKGQEWQGLDLMRQDFAGELWILRELLDWCDLPADFFSEGSPVAVPRPIPPVVPLPVPSLPKPPDRTIVKILAPLGLHLCDFCGRLRFTDVRRLGRYERRCCKRCSAVKGRLCTPASTSTHDSWVRSSARG